jgi:hypothetical protein
MLYIKQDTLTRREFDDLKSQIEELRRAAASQEIPWEVGTRLENVESLNVESEISESALFLYNSIRTNLY